MKRSSLCKQIDLALATRRALCIWGPPGVGKSQIVYQRCAARGLPVLDWRLVLMDSVDLRGVPSVDEIKVGSAKFKVTNWNSPGELPRDGEGVIFMDEFPQAAVQVQNAATQLILDNRLGQYVLPPGWRIIAAGNKDGDRAATNRMPTHVANRFKHVDLVVDVDEWVEWAQQEKPDGTFNIEPRIVAYHKYRRQFLHFFDPKSQEKAFASPRSWEFASDDLIAAEREGLVLEPDEQMEMFAGQVGQVAATDFVGFLRVLDKLVQIDSILLAPDSATIPEDQAIVYATVYALLDRADRKTLPLIARYIGRCGSEWEFAFFKLIESRKADLCKTKTFVDWAAANHDKL